MVIPAGPRWKESKLPKAPKKRNLDDEHSEGEPTLPYKQVPELVHKADQREKQPELNIPAESKGRRKDRVKGKDNSDNIPVNKGKENERNVAEKAYAIVRPIDKPGTIDRIVDEIWKTRINSELRDWAVASPKVAEALRKSLTKRRVKPPRIHQSVDPSQQIVCLNGIHSGYSL